MKLLPILSCSNRPINTAKLQNWMLLLGIIHFVCAVYNNCRTTVDWLDLCATLFPIHRIQIKANIFNKLCRSTIFISWRSVRCAIFLFSQSLDFSLISFALFTFSANAIFLRRTDSFVWISVELGWIRFTNSICIFFWKLRFLLFLLMFSLLLSGIFAIAKQSIDLKLGELKTRWMDIYFFRYRTIKKE